MIINPYKTESHNEITNKQNNEPVQKIVDAISELVIKNDNKLLESNNKNKIIEKIEQYICDKYKETNTERIKEIAEAVISKLFGYGILQKYIDDEDITDIRAVCYDRIYVKKRGSWLKVQEEFRNKEAFQEYVRFCCLKNDACINFQRPVTVFSDRKNSLRIEAGIEPANVESPNLVIRIHRKNGDNTLEEIFVRYGLLDKASYLQLKDVSKKMLNVVLCGKGGSGKTTLLKAIINEIPEEVAITTNEETAELFLEGRNVIQRECLMSRLEDKSIDLEYLARQALVMSNDVIIIGELKGAEANVFFDSISTGHMGLATVHADSAENTIDRIITLIKKDIKAQYYTENFLRRFLTTSIDRVIYLENFTVKTISKLKFDEETNKIIWKNEYSKEMNCYSTNSY